MGSHVVGQIELTSLESEHILTALRGFYADQGAWCEVCSEIVKKVLPIAQTDGFLKDWEILELGEYRLTEPKVMNPCAFLIGLGTPQKPERTGPLGHYDPTPRDD